MDSTIITLRSRKWMLETPSTGQKKKKSTCVVQFNGTTLTPFEASTKDHNKDETDCPFTLKYNFLASMMREWITKSNAAFSLADGGLYSHLMEAVGPYSFLVGCEIEVCPSSIIAPLQKEGDQVHEYIEVKLTPLTRKFRWLQLELSSHSAKQFQEGHTLTSEEVSDHFSSSKALSIEPPSGILLPSLEQIQIHALASSLEACLPDEVRPHSASIKKVYLNDVAREEIWKPSSPEGASVACTWCMFTRPEGNASVANEDDALARASHFIATNNRLWKDSFKQTGWQMVNPGKRESVGQFLQGIVTTICKCTIQGMSSPQFELHAITSP